jgi:hypothetical protein
MTLLALLAVAAVLSVYLFAREVRGPDGKRADKNTYSFLEGRVDVDSPQEAVANSNIATNFQLLSVYPNIVFGMLGNFAVPIINALSYAVGSILLQWRAPHFKSLIEYNDNTLHGFIARTHGVPRLKKYTTLISLGVFGAVVAFEVVFLARILSVLVGGNQITYYTFVFFLVTFLSAAVYFGGQRTSFFADNFHLFFAYIGIHACLAELLGIIGGGISSDSILLIIGIITSIMIAFRIKFLFIPTATARTRTLNMLIAASATYLLVRILLTVHVDGYLYLQDAHQKWMSSFSVSTGTQIAMILAAICPAIFANFVDFSFWHRLRALTQNSSANDQKSASEKQLKTGLFLFIVESPLTWVLPLVIGSLAIIAFPVAKDILTNGTGDPVAAVVQQILHAPGIVTRAVGLLLVIGLVSVAVSTVDSYLASLSYLYAKDMARPDRTESQNVSSGRVFQIFVGLVVVFFFVILDIFIQKTDLLIALFLTIFAPLAALSPAAVWPLLSGRRYKPSATGTLFLVLSCVGSGILGLAIGILAVISEATPNSMLYWLPIPIAFTCSWSMYLVFLLMAKEEK